MRNNKNTKNDLDFIQSLGGRVIEETSQDSDKEFIASLGGRIIEEPKINQSTADYYKNKEFKDYDPNIEGLEGSEDVVKRTGQVVRGGVEGIPALIDGATMVTTLPKYTADFVKECYESKRDAKEIASECLSNWLQNGSFHLAQKTTEKFDELTGGYFKPTDTLGKALNLTGGMLTGFGGLKAFGNVINLTKGVRAGKIATAEEGIQTLTKGLGETLAPTQVAEATGVGFGIEGTKEYSFFEEGSALKVVEDVLKGVAGGAAGKASFYTLNSIAQKPIMSSFNSPNVKKEIFEEMSKASQLKEIYEAKTFVSKKIGEEYVRDHLTKSIMDFDNFSTAQREVLKQNILWDNPIPHKSQIIEDCEKFLTNKHIDAEDVYSSWLNKARETVNPNSHVLGEHSLNTFETVLEKTTDSKFKTSLEEIRGDIFSINGVVFRDEIDFFKYNPESYEKWAKQLGEGVGKPELNILRTIDGVKKLDKLVRGNKEVFYEVEQIKKSIFADLSKSNKIEAKNLQAVNEYFNLETSSNIRTDLANSLVNGKFPSYVYSFTETPEGIKQLQSILGNSEVGANIFTNLKRTRLAEEFQKVVGGQIVVDGAVQPSNYFNSEALLELMSSPAKKDLINSLVGKECFNELNKIASTVVKKNTVSEASLDTINNIAIRELVSSSMNILGIPYRAVMFPVKNIGLPIAKFVAYMSTKKSLLNQIYSNAEKQSLNKIVDVLELEANKFMSTQEFRANNVLNNFIAKTERQQQALNYVEQPNYAEQPATYNVIQNPNELDAIRGKQQAERWREYLQRNNQQPAETVSEASTPMVENIESVPNNPTSMGIEQQPILGQPIPEQPIANVPIPEQSANAVQPIVPQKTTRPSKKQSAKNLLELDNTSQQQTVNSKQANVGTPLSPREIEIGKAIGLGDVTTIEEWNTRCIELGMQDFMIGQKASRDLAHHEKPYTNPHYNKVDYDQSPIVL